MDSLPILLAAALLVLGVGLALLVRSRSRPAPAPEVLLRFTPHAAERMAERRVRDADVRATVAAPDRVIATTYFDRGAAGEAGERDSVRLEKELRGRTLKVWVPPDWRSRVPVAVKSVAWQYGVTFRIPRSRVGTIIGRGGATIRELEQTYGVRITVDGGMGLARIVGDEEDALIRARRHVEGLVR